MRIRVDDQRHASLESSIIAEFAECGFQTVELTYHRKCVHCEKVAIGKPLRDLIAANHSYGAWLVRTRSDRMSFANEPSRFFKWDSKTSGWKEGQDFAIEIMPLFSMYSDCLLGCNGVFFCRRNCGADYAYQPGELLSCVRRILVPRRSRNEAIVDGLIDWAENLCQRFGVQTDVFATSNCQGTGDPFAAIAIDEIEPRRTIADFFDAIRHGRKWRV